MQALLFDISILSRIAAGVVTASEWVVAAVTISILAAFTCASLYLWRLTLAALRARPYIAPLAPPASPEVELLAHDAAPVHVPSADGQSPHFAILLPAHNEELVIGAALRGLADLDYPRDRFDVYVIADNCSDATAHIARRHGATVIERTDTVRIGKGFALAYGIDHLRSEAATGDAYDAIVILDADTLVARNLLTAFAAALARGEKVLQARYEVLNAEESWRTRLMACALALAHTVKPLGRERLQLSDGLKGNGMCFARDVVERVPWSGASITEDIEYTLRVCRAGYRVAFVPSTAVWAQMPTTAAQAAGQRRRWEGGRYQLLASVAPKLLMEAARTRDRVLLDRAVELFTPPFAEMFACPVGLFLLSAAAFRGTGHAWAVYAASAAVVLLIIQAGYLALGLWVARVPGRIASAILVAPAYIAWKLALYAGMLAARSTGGWKRTERRPISL